MKRLMKEKEARKRTMAEIKIDEHKKIRKVLTLRKKADLQPDASFFKLMKRGK